MNENNNSDEKITVVFKSDKDNFKANEPVKMSRAEFKKLKLEDIYNLTTESFWQNIKFISKRNLIEINDIKRSRSVLCWPPSDKCFELLVDELVYKHVNAAFEYLKAKRRLTEKKYVYFTPKEEQQFKDPLIVGKESLQLLYPEQKDYFDELTDNDLQKEIDEKLMLNTEYDKELEYGNVLRDKDQSHQIDKIRQIKEENLYTELLSIDKGYIRYFSLDFLYRKIILEKSNDGKSNDFQKAFVEQWNNKKNYDQYVLNICSIIFLFRSTIEHGKCLELCKFVCQAKINGCISNFKSNHEISKDQVKNFLQGLDIVATFLEVLNRSKKKLNNNSRLKNMIRHNGIDSTIKEILDILQNENFRLMLKEKAEEFPLNGNINLDFLIDQFARKFFDIFLKAKKSEDKEGLKKIGELNDNDKKYVLQILSIAPTCINKCSVDFILNNLDNKVVRHAFCERFYYYESLVGYFFDKNNKLILKYEEKFMKMLEACPSLIDDFNLDFIFDNLDNKIVWYAFCNGYCQYDNGKLFDHCIDKDKKLIPERKEKLFKLIAARPDLLINVDKDKNKDKNYEFLYPLISKLILEKNWSLLQVFKSMNYMQYTAFWTDYFNWFKENLKTKTKTQIKQQNINTESNENLSEINTSTSQNGQNKNNKSIIDIIDIEEDKSLISENNFKKIIECERFINQKYQIYQENYWDSSENDLVWRTLKEKWGFMYQEKTELFQIEISQAKYLQSHQDLSENAVKDVKIVCGCIRNIETGGIYGYPGYYVHMIKKMEEYYPNYPGLSELKSYLPYLVIIHWLIHIAIIILSLAIVAIPWIFLAWGWGLGLSFITVPACCIACIFCWESLRIQDYNLAEKIFGLRSKLQEYANRRKSYREVTDQFEKFIDSELCSVGDQAWNKVKEYFQNNAPDLENKIKKYIGIEDFKDIKLNDVQRFIRRNHNTFMDKINNFFDDALTDKIKDMRINEIENKFRNYVHQIDNNFSVACEKFIKKNIVEQHLDNIKEMLEIKGRRAYFRHKPNTNEQLMQDECNISLDLSKLLLEILKEEHEKDKNIQKDDLNTDKKNESVNDNKPIVENEEEEINTSSKQ